VKAIRRAVVVTAGLIAIAGAMLPAVAAAQCENRKDPPKPPDKIPSKVMVPTFHGDGKLAVEFSKDMRDRIDKIENSKVIWVIPCEMVNAYLTTSGYKADSALAINDLSALGKQVNASESLDGVVSKTADGQIHAEGRLYYANNISASEPLPPVVGKDVDDAARKLADEYHTARAEIDGYRKCYNGITDQKYDVASAGAKEAILAYPPALLARTCLLTAYTNMPSVSVDSIIAGARYVVDRDTANILAMAYLGDAYTKRAQNATAQAAKQSDKDSAVTVYLKLYDADPSQTAVAEALAALLAQSGSPAKALAIVDTLALTNPDDAGILDTRFHLLLAAKRYKDAYKAFDQLTALDTTKSTVEYFKAIIGAAQADSNDAKILLYATRATDRFPKEASFWMLSSRYLNQKGEIQQALDAAKKALKLNPKEPNAIPYIMQMYAKLNAPDSAIAFAREQIAGGANKDSIGLGLIPLLNSAIQKAQAADTDKDSWQAMLALAQRVDSVAPSAGSKFFIGVAAVSLGKDIITDLGKSIQDPAFDKSGACATLTQGADFVQLGYDSMTSGGGGKFNGDAAGQVLASYPQLLAYVGQIKPSIPNCK